MKRVLIVIPDMEIGGAQKSLLSFLQCLTEAEKKEYEFYLTVAKPSGTLYAQIPDFVHMIPPSKELQWLGTKAGKELLLHRFSFRGVIGSLSWILRKRLGLFRSTLNLQQKLWENWKKIVPADPDCYDVAISYMDGFTNYYVIDKVQACKKVLWVHNQYQKIEYDPLFDRMYYNKCNQIITISEECRRCIVQEFPQHESKVQILENISSPLMITERSKEGIPTEYGDCSGWKLLSVGRLNPQKGFDLAIDAAAQLKEEGIDFRWFIVGEGLEREKLQSMIDRYGLKEHVLLLGKRENPYVYMRNCDILVQSSRFEGRSIVLDEAKMLCKPIVATNYPTVKDSIEHGKSGWVVDMTPQALCDGIVRMMHDQALRQQLTGYLETQPKGNAQELEKYIELMMK